MKIRNDKKGNITLEIKNRNKNFYLHSKYDVFNEAKHFSKNFSEKSKGINILYGFGLGYHIQEIKKILKKNQLLYVLELREDIFNFAKENRNLEDIFEDNRIKLIVSNNYEELIFQFKKINIEKDNSEFFIHEPSVNAIEESNIEFKNILDDLKVLKRNVFELNQINEMDVNSKFNKKLNDREASLFFDKFENIPGILISGGPSLDYTIEKLKNFKGKSVILSVGRSLRAFSDLSFDPDMFLIVEQSHTTRVHINNYENSNIPFIYLISASKVTVDAYKGPRFYFYNGEYNSNKENSLRTKSSVASAALSMLIKMGCNPIIFVGQDLGFYENLQHSKKVIYENYSERNYIMNDYKYEIIKNVFGKEIYTNKGYKSMKSFIEKLIRENDNIEFINCSYNGAKIEGAKYKDIDYVYEKYIDIKNIKNIDGMIEEIVKI